jgi:uncharacterized iron-regulated membrane protein
MRRLAVFALPVPLIFALVNKELGLLLLALAALIAFAIWRWWPRRKPKRRAARRTSQRATTKPRRRTRRPAYAR